MVPYPRLSFFDIDTTKFSGILSELLQKGKIDMDYADDYLYDDHDDFFDEDSSNYHPDAAHELSTHTDEDGWNEFDSWDEDYEEEDDVWDDGYNDSMDGDFDSAMRDAGWGTDEDYGYYGEDY